MEQDLRRELVQAHLNTPVTAGLSGPQAIAVSSADSMRAASLRGAAAVEEGVSLAVLRVVMIEVVLVVREVDSMVEGVDKGKPDYWWISPVSA
jgi:hypothetical protein